LHVFAVNFAVNKRQLRRQKRQDGEEILNPKAEGRKRPKAEIRRTEGGPAAELSKTSSPLGLALAMNPKSNRNVTQGKSGGSGGAVSSSGIALASFLGMNRLNTSSTASSRQRVEYPNPCRLEVPPVVSSHHVIMI
jgi:hypothetical protein